jgi:lysozyme
MKPSYSLINFIKKYESLHDGDLHKIGVQPKSDPVGIWTEGYGRAMRKNGKWMTTEDYPTQADILPYATIKSEAEAEKALIEDLNKFSKQVMSRLDVDVTQSQFDALCSHSYNCGFSSTLYKLVNTKASEDKLKNWFTTKYITAQGVFLKGLQFRRNDEWEMFSKGDYKREYKISV